ncbi:MAG TPA: 50S ribosomal protein L25 [bacterium]|nr:50S ribosomal protein L25 [bacterium]
MQIEAQKRETLGKKTKHIRKEGKIPAVVFGKDMNSTNISLDYNTFDKVYKESGETDLIDIKIGDEKIKVLIKDVQLDPVSGRISHVGFYKPDLTVKTEAEVPVEIVGEENNELIKSKVALALQLIQEIKVEALPEDIPHSFIVDVSNLNNIGDSVSISQLNYNREKVSIPEIDPEEMVVRIEEVKVEEEEVEEVSEEAAIADLEATAEKPEEEENQEESNEK